MAERVRRFIPRAPRYVLRTQDRQVMRFCLSTEHVPSAIEQTILLNLSETGAAFLVDPSVEMKIGDHIKVEVPIPSGDQIAWWGHVVRIEEYESGWFNSRMSVQTDDKLLVAIRFEQLPEPHSRAIRKGVELSLLKAMRDQQYRTFLYYRAMFIQRFVPIMVYAILTILAIGFIYYFSLPTENYDKDRGSPWGKRFNF